MLIGFTVENYLSFLEETSLSMVATGDKEHRAFNVIETSHDDLLKSALIYGANASGKSNLLNALHYMKLMITSSVDMQIEYIKACQPFSFREDAAGLPSKFEISLQLDDIVYDYGFHILAGRVSREYLYKKARRRTKVFERTAPEYDSIKMTDDMADVRPQKKNVRDDVLFLSWAAYMNNTLAMRLVNWIANSLIIGKSHVKSRRVLMSRSDSSPKTFSEFEQSLVRKADNDIQNIAYAPDGTLISSHKMFSNDWTVNQTVTVPFNDYSSDGTKQMLVLSSYFAEALEGSAVIVIDEIDLSLHPALVRHLLSQINSYAHNHRNAQLICTVHDVMLLEEDIRRDQIWFVDKDEHGVSELYPLSDFRHVRKNSDVLKRYLLGVYGAIPDLDRGDGDE